MISKFKEDFFWMLRKEKGYYPWVDYNRWRLGKLLDECHAMCLKCKHAHEGSNEDLIRTLVSRNVCENELIDLFLKALIRAEIRFVSRYVPQRSHEERLTGNLVAEIDNSIHLIADEVRNASLKRYSESRIIDFLYYDLSRGGKIEKETGADLGFILVVDLPDHSFLVKSLILQAKKIHNSCQIDDAQYEVLKRWCAKEGKECPCYLFYDMNLETLTSPLVLPIDELTIQTKHEEATERNSGSFSLRFNDVRKEGYPLSIFVALRLTAKEYGKAHSSFKDAREYFDSLSREQWFNGRVGIASIGKKINFNTDNNEILEISI